MNRNFLPLLILATLTLAGSGCVRNPATRKVHARLISEESERKIGEEAKKEIVKEYSVIKSTSISAYVTRVGQRLAQVSDRPTIDYDFTVLDNDLINAFAVPGGFIFVTRGLLENVEDEAELAMVLGHELGHVTALHGVQMIQKEMGQNALTILGTVGAAIVAGPEAMLVMAHTANLFSSLYLLGYSRDKELEADNLGLLYLLRAGYDPQAALRFLKQLEKKTGDDAKGWDLYFRTHPSTKERISIIEHMIGEGQEDVERSHKAEFQKIKAMLPKADVTQRGKISGQKYENPAREISLTVPPNWSLGYFNPIAMISFESNDKKGEGRIQEVDLSSTTVSAENLAYAYSKQQGFQFISGRDVLYPAGYGYLGRFVGPSPAGKGLDIRLFATIRKGRGYVIYCGADFEKADSYVLDIEQIMRSFRFTPS